MKAKHIFIQPETDAALSKLGGTTRAENIRRAVALAEVAGELAEAVKALLGSMHDQTNPVRRLSHALNQYEAAKAREVKQ